MTLMIKTLALALLLLTALLATACGDDGAASGDKPAVIATTGFAEDLVREVAGPDAEVEQLVPDGAKPHSSGASAKDRARLDGADLVVAFGRAYEEGLPLDDLRAERFEIAESVGELREADHAEEDGEHAEEEPGNDRDRDPHVWMDPTRMAAAAPGIADALAKVDPDSADAYRSRAKEAAARLRALDAELRRTLAVVPEERRKLVTSHESVGYFADRYGFELVAAPFGLAPEAEASATDLQDVVAAVRRSKVPVVFAQQGDDPKVMRRIAEETGVEVIDDLRVESAGPGGGTYAEAMRFNARRIAEALR